jgi:pyruvate/2-oxoglutarate dehydrogenase complex dihydrolipoamide dehydrogenase (E3) component
VYIDPLFAAPAPGIEAAPRIPEREQVGGTAEQGYLQVNGQLETNVAGIYALGDVKGGPAFTHVAYDDYRILHTNLLEQGNASTQDRLVPYTIFIDPQLGRVGLSENEARRQGRTIRVAKLTLDEFFALVSEREGVDLPDAVFHARVVIGLLTEAVSMSEIKDVRAQLPADFAQLFKVENEGDLPEITT